MAGKGLIAGLRAARSPVVRVINGSIANDVARWWSFCRATGLLWGYFRAFFPDGSAPPRCIHWMRNFIEVLERGSAPRGRCSSGIFPENDVSLFSKRLFSG